MPESLASLTPPGQRELLAADLYSDANCTFPVRVASELRILACSATAPPAYATGGKLGDPGSSVYRVGAETTAAPFSRDPFSGACVSARATNEVFFEVDEVDPTTLVPLTMTTD